MRRTGCILVATVLSGSPLLPAAEPPATQSAVWDTQPDTWTATDDLGRRLPGFPEVGPPRAGKYVGIFYFLWMGQHTTDGPYDITRILAAHPGAMTQPTCPPWGPAMHFHHWGEPLFGYYLSDDAWVLRKHAQMLADAGVDVVIFDVTNQVTYPRAYGALCEAFSAVRRAGGRTPQIAFLCPFWDPPKVANELYEALYRPGRYRDLWFVWKGRPLLLADPARVPPEINAFFTLRKPQPDYFTGPSGTNEWGWLEIHPQHVYRNDRGEPEQMTVGVAQNGSGRRLCAFSEKNTYGRSWHDGRKDDRPDAVLHGCNFAEQWERALKIDPEFIFITGWNEWIAMRLPEFNSVREPVMFVDQYTQEYSRDVEPMKGGHGDNYYYQMIGYIRRFKGVRRPPPPVSAATIAIDGDFSDWINVRPEYRDDIGDTAHRDHPGYDDVGRYVNRTGRNDFVLLKVAHDDRHLYFYARTHDPLTAHTDPNWMMLFIDADGRHDTGWEGFDFAINRTVRGPDRTTVEAASGGWNWNVVGEIAYRSSGTDIEVAVPRPLIRLDGDANGGQFTFKWADNLQLEGDPRAFTVNGDAAPNGRFAFVATMDR